ncbi:MULTISPECIES: AraC family transcriptional regulator [unclassified Flavobacterium]|uniref:helix-turn-helix domain-containing protein n=1 Tax=unclassified Flavobacterium TaxID=196869 RepID=UPI00096096DD|nr:MULTISPECIES: AraC family transcriptional regulator [unclassified Flavobacterium]MBN9283891.1 helix-turn-helix transcriptional regulator [Flavobacterium sp.]OJV68612.1 MAG: AraC family transcriptional regulator [Flavobacterium sp. 40-81]
MMKIAVKNMVCQRCVLAVTQILDKIDLPYQTVIMGEVTLADDMPADQKLKQFSDELEAIGFEIIDDKRKQLIEKVKGAIINFIHYDQEKTKLTLSEFLSDKVQYDYNYLSSLFSEMEGITIEKYLINQKIEKVKELIVYDELSLKQIADLLGYSSVAYLSNQFKKVTGLTPSHFKNIRSEKRIPLDKV